MCVILVAQTRRLSAALLHAATEENPHGNGIAWIQGGRVHWRKAITIEEAIELARRVPMPYAFHARLRTVGVKSGALCHPFPIRAEATGFELCGTERRGVVFHNGTWFGWEDQLEAIADEDDIFLSGPWSDSRAMATIAASRGAGALEALVPASQRICLVTPRGITTRGEGWLQIEKGIAASNDRFAYRLQTNAGAGLFANEVEIWSAGKGKRK